MSQKKTMRRCLSGDDVSFGGWIQIGHPAVAQLMASTGFEWLAVDLEHGAIDIGDCLALVNTIREGGSVPVARIPYNDPIWIRRCLDVGFGGLVVPLVSTAEDARKATRVGRYPPEGARGIGFCPANTFGKSLSADTLAQENDSICIIAQIETAAGVENLEEILGVGGIDGIFIGPYDLSGSFGVLGQFDHPVMLQAYQKCIACCNTSGKMLGIHVVPPSVDQVALRLREGFNLIALSLDVTILAEGCKALLRGAHAQARAAGKSGDASR